VVVVGGGVGGCVHGGREGELHHLLIGYEMWL